MSCFTAIRFDVTFVRLEPVLNIKERKHSRARTDKASEASGKQKHDELDRRDRQAQYLVVLGITRATRPRALDAARPRDRSETSRSVGAVPNRRRRVGFRVRRRHASRLIFSRAARPRSIVANPPVVTRETPPREARTRGNPRARTSLSAHTPIDRHHVVLHVRRRDVHRRSRIQGSRHGAS